MTTLNDFLSKLVRKVDSYVAIGGFSSRSSAFNEQDSEQLHKIIDIFNNNGLDSIEQLDEIDLYLTHHKK